VNDLKISAEGLFGMPADGSYDMDIKFNAPSNLKIFCLLFLLFTKTISPILKPVVKQFSMDL
jgi:hypothetical protein